MKKIAMGAAAAVLALVPAGAAHATTTNTTGGHVSIGQDADYDFVGTNLDVALQVRCSGGTGTVEVNVAQAPPETPYPVAQGTGPQVVVCDGHTRAVAVTIIGVGFDAGKAKATATLVTPLTTLKTTKAARTITIRVV